MPYTELKKAAQQALEALERGDLYAEVTAENILRAALAEPDHIADASKMVAEPQEPVVWQRRMRLRETVRTFPQQSVWTDWFPCTEQAAQEFANSKDEQWEYEVRTLYTAPQPKAEQEPAAWQWLNTANFRKKLPADANKSEWNPLYAAPQPAIDAAAIRTAAPDLLEALRDMYEGWKYIRSTHGDLYGIGWDRCDEKARAAIAKAGGAA